MPPATTAMPITSTRNTLRTDHSISRPSISVLPVVGVVVVAAVAPGGSMVRVVGVVRVVRVVLVVRMVYVVEVVYVAVVAVVVGVAFRALRRVVTVRVGIIHRAVIMLTVRVMALDRHHVVIPMSGHALQRRLQVALR